MDANFTHDAKIEELGERFGAAGPYAIVCLFGEAKKQGSSGRVRYSTRALCHDAFIPDRRQAQEIISVAGDLGLLNVETLDDREFEVSFAQWHRWQEAFRKRAERKTSSSVPNVRKRPLQGQGHRQGQRQKASVKGGK